MNENAFDTKSDWKTKASKRNVTLIGAIQINANDVTCFYLFDDEIQMKGANSAPVYRCTGNQWNDWMVNCD